MRWAWKRQEPAIQNYKSLFNKLKISEQDKQITEATTRGVYGTKKFHFKTAKLITRPTRLKAHGGDRKSENYQNQPS